MSVGVTHTMSVMCWC